MQTSRYYFIGIGGIGMSALAQYLMDQGALIGGYDKTPSSITTALETQGALISYDEEVTAIDQQFMARQTTVVYTPAIPKNHPQYTYFLQNNYPVIKRAALLGKLTHNKLSLAVAGTHGKTTTSSILAHLLKGVKYPFTALIGGIMQDEQSNYYSSGTDTFLVEADEFDRSFLQLTPTIAAITSIDADHLDIYASSAAVREAYHQFAQQVTQKRIVAKGIPIEGVTYSIDEEADFYIQNSQVEGWGYRFDLHTPHGVHHKVFFSQLGLHNLSNALAAFCIASSLGLDERLLCKHLQNFKGVARRLQLVYCSENRIYIDDYAHHPTEIKAVYATLDNAYPEREKCVIFQPHLYTRTRDFMDEFALELAQFDRVILLPIYPARELPIAGITAPVLANKIKSKTKVEVMTKEALLQAIPTISAQLIATLGAGDIGLLVNSIKQKLTDHEQK